MSSNKIEAIDLDAAHSTVWATDHQGGYMLVLVDEDNEPFAFAAYTLDEWKQVFYNLLVGSGLADSFMKETVQ